MKRLLMILFIATITFSGFAQELDGWKINGQVQLRTELDGRDFLNSTHPLTFASLRTRLGVEKTFEKSVQLFVQFQDSRVFGEEPNTISAIDNIDLHQGFVKLIKPFGLDVNVQAGRFEVAYGTERFFGAVGWHYIGRSFDGVRFNISPEYLNLDLFALTIDESNSYISSATQSFTYSPSSQTPSASIYGFWQQNKLNEASKFDLFGYFEINREDADGTLDTNKLELFTLGGSYWGNYGELSTIFEAAYQFGAEEGIDVSAYLLSLQFFYKTGISKIGLGADILSGNDPESASLEYNSFRPSYGTNHKFYGYMDYFISFPLWVGLNDVYASVNLTPKDCKINFDAVFHLMMSNHSIKITSFQDPVGKDENMYGQELDLTAKYAFTENTNIIWGGSLYFPGELFKNSFGSASREDAAFWTYLMITANL